MGGMAFKVAWNTWNICHRRLQGLSRARILVADELGEYRHNYMRGTY